MGFRRDANQDCEYAGYICWGVFKLPDPWQCNNFDTLQTEDNSHKCSHGIINAY